MIVYTFAHFLKNSVGKREKETKQNTLALAAQYVLKQICSSSDIRKKKEILTLAEKRIG